ncbi:hypothetical protein KVG88_00560 [Pseudomonas sp. SWRI74]|uniref:Lipoprotein n=1 Tax=Pseudomonas azerbaijanoccidentalis TaxID=2842347 RepID=A0ABS6QI71_9PSED|nr:hypothetical protein [Pseudomonas azerbaijanoccidentalis]MBV4518540.1 hypothetical protein [Pseudomonas azerbaijanoccidentalis]
MKLIVGALAVALLAGCTTPSDLMKEAPELSANTKKDPKTYALCVYPSWQDYRSSAVMSETSAGYRLVAGNDMNGQTDDVLDIRKIKGGSAVKLYQRMAWQQLGRAELKKSFNSCL